MELKTFCERICLKKEAIDLILEERFSKDEYEKNKSIFQESDEAFYKVMLNKKNWKEDLLWYYCRFACDAYEVYKDAGIPEELYWENFSDIELWCSHCYLENGCYGIAVYDWFWRFFQLKILRLGRLQYEIMDGDFDFRKRQFIREGEGNYIGIHIPQGPSLKWEDCEQSLEEAYKWFGKDMEYQCHSWLLFPGLQEVLPETSNIIQFQKHFELIKIDYNEREAEWRVFGPVLRIISDYPEKTSLQRSMKKLLLEGKVFGNGVGRLIK